MNLKRLLSFSLAVFTCVCLLLATDRSAYAYVDPGSGLLALQSAASVMAAVGYFMRRRIGALFGRKEQGDTIALPTPAAKESSRKAA